MRTLPLFIDSWNTSNSRTRWLLKIMWRSRLFCTAEIWSAVKSHALLREFPQIFGPRAKPSRNYWCILTAWALPS